MSGWAPLTNLQDYAGEANSALLSSIHGFGSVVHDTYDHTLGPAGQAFNDKVTAPVGAIPTKLLAGGEGAWQGIGQFGGRLGANVTGDDKTPGLIPAAANVVWQVPVVVRDITVPTGQAVGNVGMGINALSAGAGGALDKTGAGVSSFGKYAGWGIGIAVVLVVVAILAFAFKNPKTIAAAAV